MASVQQSFNINPESGFPGDIAQASAPHVLDSGVINIPTSATRNPRPGDAVYYDTATNAFAIPTSAAQSHAVVGILSYRKDQVANANSIVEYADGDECEVGIFGGFWVKAGEALEYGNLLSWSRTAFDWEVLTAPANFAALVNYPIACVSRKAVADGGIAIARLGYGRIK